MSLLHLYITTDCNIESAPVACIRDFVYRVESGFTEADDLFSSLLVCVGFLYVKVIVKTRA